MKRLPGPIVDMNAVVSRGDQPDHWGDLITTPDRGTRVSPFGIARQRKPLSIGKPFETKYGQGLGRNQRPTNKVVMIGDRLETDVDGDFPAGMKTVLFRTGHSFPSEMFPAYLNRQDWEIVSLDEIRATDLDLIRPWN